MQRIAKRKTVFFLNTKNNIAFKGKTQELFQRTQSLILHLKLTFIGAINLANTRLHHLSEKKIFR